MRIKEWPITCVAVPFAAGILVAAAISFPVIAAPVPDSKVEIDDFAFSPARITVKAGTTVAWLNADDTPHTVASSSKLFKSKVLDTDGSFSFTFTTPGMYEYFCSLHPYMTGTVVVEATSGSSAAQ
ncbi:MAG TPA: cupredoxin family copper-binding protein [Xanthobacteraceae bacterium]|jgi:plastocyanin